jgi:hypothetical protein
VLPLLPARVDTLADYGTAPGLVHLSDRPGLRMLLAFPRGTTRSLLGPGESVRSVEGRGSWTLRIAGRQRRTYRLQAALMTLRRPFAVCRVTVAGRPLPRRSWRYDRAGGVLRASFRTRRGPLRAGACRR